MVPRYHPNPNLEYGSAGRELINNPKYLGWLKTGSKLIKTRLNRIQTEYYSKLNNIIFFLMSNK